MYVLVILLYNYLLLSVLYLYLLDVIIVYPYLFVADMDSR